MTESFGARLRRQREEQNIALVTIAAQTKIKASLLESLERDDVSRWPSGIFRRAYVRAYAHAIGLNPDDVLREFLEKYPDPSDDVDPVATLAASDGSPVRGAPPTRFHYFVDSAMASLSRVRRNSVPAHGFSGTAPAHGLIGPAPADVPDVNEAVTQPPCPESPVSEPDLVAFADVCAQLGRAANAEQVQPLLQKAACILDAAGLIVWVWDDTAAELTPALVHGYSETVVAQLPAVTEHADNITAEAFRSGEARTIAGDERANGALVVPLLTPAGCRGVLALELRPGRESSNAVQALATIFAALVAQLIGDDRRADVPGTTIGDAPVEESGRQVC